MARPWSEVVADPNFQSLAPDAKEAARNAYFQQNVLPNIPQGANASAIRLKFDQDTARPVQPTQPASEWSLNNLGRQAALAGRAVVNGVTALPMMAMDTGVALRNLGTNLANGVTPTVSDFNPFPNEGKKSPQQYELPSQTFNQALNDVGVPHPESTSENIASAVESGLAGSRVPAPEAAQQAPANFKPTPPPELTPQQQTLQAGRDAGYVVPPSTVKPSVPNLLAESVAGKAATQQAASLRNQQITNALAVDALGLPKGTTITPEVLKGLRTEAGKVYAQVSGSGRITADSQFASDVAQLGKASSEVAADFPEANVAAADKIAELVKSLDRPSFDAKSAMAYMRMLRQQGSANIRGAQIAGGDPEKMALGSAQRDAAGALEDMVVRHLTAQGKGDLAEQFDQARTLIAKTHSVEDALNPATGNIVAKDLASQLNRNKPLTGPLRTAGNFARAFPKATAEINHSGPVSAVDAILAGGGALAAHNPLLLAYPAARMAARYGLLTPGVQNGLLPQAASGPISPAYLMGGMGAQSIFGQ